jgi:hypothetical protein
MTIEYLLSYSEEEEEEEEEKIFLYEVPGKYSPVPPIPLY